MEKEMVQDLSEQISKILKDNITLHSIRQGEGVFNITSFEIIRDQLLTLTGEKWAKTNGNLKLVEDQSYPDMVFFCPTCKQMVKNTLCNITGENTKVGWRKVLIT